jgi:hypothetical protein
MAHYTMPHLETVGEGSISKVSPLRFIFTAVALIINSREHTDNEQKHMGSPTRSMGKI